MSARVLHMPGGCPDGPGKCPGHDTGATEWPETPRPEAASAPESADQSPGSLPSRRRLTDRLREAAGSIRLTAEPAHIDLADGDLDWTYVALIVEADGEQAAANYVGSAPPSFALAVATLLDTIGAITEPKGGTDPQQKVRDLLDAARAVADDWWGIPAPETATPAQRAPDRVP